MEKKRSNHFSDEAIERGFPDHISTEGKAYYSDRTVLCAPAEDAASVGEPPQQIFIVADRHGPYSEFMYEFKAQDDDIGYTRDDLALRLGLRQAWRIVKSIDAEGAIYNDDEILTNIILIEIEKALAALTSLAEPAASVGEPETHCGLCGADDTLSPFGIAHKQCMAIARAAARNYYIFKMALTNIASAECDSDRQLIAQTALGAEVTQPATGEEAGRAEEPRMSIEMDETKMPEGYLIAAYRCPTCAGSKTEEFGCSIDTHLLTRPCQTCKGKGYVKPAAAPPVPAVATRTNDCHTALHGKCKRCGLPVEKWSAQPSDRCPGVPAVVEGEWANKFPYDEPGVYWVRLVETPHQYVIAYISKEHVHYTNGDREHASDGNGRYEYLGPLSPAARLATCSGQSNTLSCRG